MELLQLPGEPKNQTKNNEEQRNDQQGEFRYGHIVSEHHIEFRYISVQRLCHENIFQDIANSGSRCKPPEKPSGANK